MSITERQRQAYDLRSSGLTLAACGKIMGVTPERVRNLYFNAKRKIEAPKRAENDPLFSLFREIGERGEHVLLNCYAVKCVADVCQISELNLRSRRNVGAKTIEKIKAALSERGLSLKE